YTPLSCLLFHLRIHTSSRSTLFPYTTLFRSQTQVDSAQVAKHIAEDDSKPTLNNPWGFVHDVLGWEAEFVAGSSGGPPLPDDLRSEEHTSELQSRVDIVCRLLLEIKKSTDRI